MSTFTLTPNELIDFIDPKSPEKLSELGGVSGLAKLLKSDLKNGLSTKKNDTDTIVTVEGSTESLNKQQTASSIAAHHGSAEETVKVFSERRQVYGTNALPPPHTKSILTFAWEALQDKTLIVLIIAAVVEVAIGIYKLVAKNEAAAILDGAAIVIAVLIVVIVSAGNDYRKQSQFRNLNDYSRSLAHTKVIRDGETIQVQNADLVVGDIVVIDTGDVISADGVYISGFNLKCDESSLTGESDAVSKGNGKDPFLLSGTKVVYGVGHMMVIGVGVNSLNGRTMMNLHSEPEDTPLQAKLSVLAGQIAKFGLASAATMIVVLLVAYFSVTSDRDNVRIAEDMILVVISAITVVVVAVPEGLPLAVTLALAHATLRMLKDNNLVRHLSACETMGNATTICSDKTGTLTQNKMTVVKARLLDTEFTIKEKEGFVDRLLPGSSHKNTIVKLAANAININSSAEETEKPGEDGELVIEFNGSKTEVALLELTRSLGFEYKADREATETTEVFPFNSEFKKMSTIIKSNSHDFNGAFNFGSENSEYVLYSKGASEIILNDCDRYVTEDGTIAPLAGNARTKFSDLIDQFANEALRTLCVAFKPLPSAIYEPKDGSTAAFDESKNSMILLGIFGIEDPVRTEVPKAVETCQKAGICVRMVTGDNQQTARSIARQCGILTDGIVMEGPEFRKLSVYDMDTIVPKLQVLARSSPQDKQVLVQCLKRLGETVAVTGDGTNDAPALKSADVGFSMGIAGTEVAKEASDIVLMDDNFVSLVKAVIWGRSVYDSVRKFLQFQLTVNVTAVLITILTSLISTIATSTNRPESVLSAVQLLWVNLIMDTFAALALATDNPNDSLLNRKPAKKSDPLINTDMWRQIIGQAIYQIVICFTMYVRAADIFGLSPEDFSKFVNEYGVNTFTACVVFNTFVLCQLFNEVNSRSISRDKNVFAGILQNNTFMFVMVFSLACQVIIVEFGGTIFHTIPLDAKTWMICIAFGFGSIPIGFLIRLIPHNPKLPSSVGELSEEEIAYEINKLHEIVLESVEQSSGKPLTAQERLRWKAAIQKTSSQLKVVGAFQNASIEAFREGVLVGAQVAMSVTTEEEPMAPLEKAPSRGLELWQRAGTKVRRQVGAIEAFRRYRRDNSLMGDNVSLASK